MRELVVLIGLLAVLGVGTVTHAEPAKPAAGDVCTLTVKGMT